MPNWGSEEDDPAEGGPPSLEPRRDLSASTPKGPSRSRKSLVGDLARPIGERRDLKSLGSRHSLSRSRSRSRSRLRSSWYRSRKSMSLSRPRSRLSSLEDHPRPRPRPRPPLNSPPNPPPRGPLGASINALGPRGGSRRNGSPKSRPG